jgi:3',5'-cyclic AMP phosphodiesterase CpdA
MSFVIAHITDPHLSPAPMPGFADLRLKRVMGFINWKRGRERLNDMGMLKRLVDDLRAQRPDHVAVTGDLVNIGMPVEFHRAALWMETLGEPSDVSFVPGNHDAYVRASMPMLATTFARWAVSDGAPESKAIYPYLRVRGEIAIIGLSSAVPTAPLMATGRLGKKQVEAFAELLRQAGAKGLARVVLIHHPPLAGAPPLRGLSDAPAFERVVRDFGAEAILHGHIHRQAVRSLPSRAARTVSGAVPVLSAPSAAAAASHPRYRAAYHLVRLDREGERWRVGARVRGLTPESAAIGEREALAV